MIGANSIFNVLNAGFAVRQDGATEMMGNGIAEIAFKELLNKEVAMNGNKLLKDEKVGLKMPQEEGAVLHNANGDDSPELAVLNGLLEMSDDSEIITDMVIPSEMEEQPHFQTDENVKEPSIFEHMIIPQNPFELTKDAKTDGMPKVNELVLDDGADEINNIVQETTVTPNNDNAQMVLPELNVVPTEVKNKEVGSDLPITDSHEVPKDYSNVVVNGVSDNDNSEVEDFVVRDSARITVTDDDGANPKQVFTNNTIAKTDVNAIQNPEETIASDKEAVKLTDDKFVSDNNGNNVRFNNTVEGTETVAFHEEIPHYSSAVKEFVGKAEEIIKVPSTEEADTKVVVLDDKAVAAKLEQNGSDVNNRNASVVTVYKTVANKEHQNVDKAVKLTEESFANKVAQSESANAKISFKEFANNVEVKQIEKQAENVMEAVRPFIPGVKQDGNLKEDVSIKSVDKPILIEVKQDVKELATDKGLLYGKESVSVKEPAVIKESVIVKEIIKETAVVKEPTIVKETAVVKEPTIVKEPVVVKEPEVAKLSVKLPEDEVHVKTVLNTKESATSKEVIKEVAIQEKGKDNVIEVKVSDFVVVKKETAELPKNEATLLKEAELSKEVTAKAADENLTDGEADDLNTAKLTTKDTKISETQANPSGIVKSDTNVINIKEPVDIKSPEFSKEIAERIVYLKNVGAGKYEIQLSPKELGKIDINIELKDGKAVVMMKCENLTTQKLLSSYAGAIRSIVEDNTGRETTVVMHRGDDAQADRQKSFSDERGGNRDWERYQEQRKERLSKHSDESFVQKLRLGIA